MRTLPANLAINVNDLDGNERFIVSDLGVDALAWFRFRYAIAVGTNADVVTSTLSPPVAISDDLRSLYCDFGRNHYDVICSLGAAKKLQLDATFSAAAPPLHVHVHLKGIYHNLGCCLDALSRIVYALSYADALTKTSTNAAGCRWFRHKVDWGTVGRMQGLPASFSAAFSNAKIGEIQNIRNTLTHGWMPPQTVHANDSSLKLLWPEHVCTARDIPWAHDPADQPQATGNGVLVPMVDIVAKHYDETSKVVTEVLEAAILQIPTFEGFHNIQIG